MKFGNKQKQSVVIGIKIAIASGRHKRMDWFPKSTRELSVVMEILCILIWLIDISMKNSKFISEHFTVWKLSQYKNVIRKTQLENGPYINWGLQKNAEINAFKIWVRIIKNKCALLIGLFLPAHCVFWPRTTTVSSGTNISKRQLNPKGTD